MKTKTPNLVGTVSGKSVLLPRGLKLLNGAQVLVLPLEWALAPGSKKPARKRNSRRAFQSEDLVGCHAGEGRAATNAAVRERLREKSNRCR